MTNLPGGLKLRTSAPQQKSCGRIELEFQNERKRVIITKETDEIILNII